jgi:N-acyl-D-glutamate deacylase
MKSLTSRSGIAIAAALICGLLAANVPAVAQDCNLVILHGRVMDPETGYDAVANVGVKDGRIAVITEEKITGRKIVEATGHVVAPGFIDIHAHGQNIGDYRMQAMQGVTTMLELESGLLPIREWYDKQGKKHLPINYGAAAGWTFARIATFSGKPPSSDPGYFQDAQSRTDWKVNLATPEQQLQS